MYIEMIAITLIFMLVVFTFSLGFYLGQQPVRKKSVAPMKKPADEEIKKMKIFNTEVSNMLSYDGSEQPDIADV